MKVKIGRYPKSDLERKVDVKIERSDTWGADHTIAYIVLPMLLQLKENKMGIPADIADIGGGNWESQTCFSFYEESHDFAFEKAVEKWDEILDKMIWSFVQLAIGDYTERYHHGTTEYSWEETDGLFFNPVNGKYEKMFNMVDKNPQGHWTDYVGMRMHEQRINEGLELFGKYFLSLWE